MTGSPGRILIPSLRFEIWGWPAAINLILGGTGAGFCLFGLLGASWFQQVNVASQLLDYHLVSPVLVAAGFLTVGIEAGKPSRGIFLLYHLRRSWMSREVLAGFVLIFFVLADWLYPCAPLKTVAALAAAAFLLCQGLMVYRARAVAVWDSMPIPFHIVLSGLAMGFGCYLLWSAAFTYHFISPPLLLIGGLGLCGDLATWYLIIRPKKNSVENHASVHLRNPFSMTLAIGIGRAVPILMTAALAVLQTLGFTSGATWFLFLVAGLCTLTGGMVQKVSLILQANALHALQAGSPRLNKTACPQNKTIQ